MPAVAPEPPPHMPPPALKPGLLGPPLPTKADPGLKVLLSDHTLVSSSGATLLEAIPAAATARADADGLVLGLTTSNGPTATLDVPIGKLRPGTRFLALGRTSLWWMTPAWGCTPSQLPGETQFLLVEITHNREYALLMPLIDCGAFRATLRPPSKANPDSLVLRVESGAPGVTAAAFPGALYVGAGADPWELLQRGVAAAARLSGPAKPRSAKAVPPSVDVFGWCTWDAFYSKVCAAGVMRGLASLVEGGAPPRLLILDDGWQQTDVDIEYRPDRSAGGAPSSPHKGPAAAASENGTAVDNAAGTGTGLAALPSQLSLAVDVAVHEAEEAVAELLAGPGDERAPEQLRGEHQLEEEAGAEALAQAAATPPPPAPSGLLALITSLLTRVQQTALLQLAHVQTAVFHLGAGLLDASTSDSWVVRIFSSLAAGPLRSTLQRFYAHASDHSRRLTGITANAKFAGASSGDETALSDPGGDLTAVVAAIKQRYGVKFVYAWHAMGAFWGGIAAGDPGVAHYNPSMLHPTPTPGMVEIDPALAWNQPVLCGVSLPLDPTALHQDMHAYLAGCGVDGVKVDVQGTIGLAGSAAGGGAALTGAYHTSLEDSVQRNFPGNHLINCMCHSTEDLYRFEHTNLARVSDDFYPTRPASHTAHIGNCAFNSLLMGELVIPDWDMFHSKHTAALLHATARAISGGPVYVSDRPGHHDFALLRRLVLPDGSVLRCRLPGRPTADCLFADVSRDGTTPLKVWNANAVTGVVAVFNVQGSAFSRPHRAFRTHDNSPGALTARVAPADVPLLRGASDVFVIYSDAKRAFRLVDAAEGGVEVPVRGNGGCDVLVISPVVRAAGVLFAPIGLVDMLNAGGAVLACALSEEGDGSAAASLQLRGGGAFMAYASHRPTGVLLNGETVDFAYNDAAGALTFSVGGQGGERCECSIRF